MIELTNALASNQRYYIDPKDIVMIADSTNGLNEKVGSTVWIRGGKGWVIYVTEEASHVRDCVCRA